jgi:hypothetical protein
MSIEAANKKGDDSMRIESANEIKKSNVKRGKGHKIFGGLLLVMGFFWLARKAGWMSHDTSWMPHEANGSPIFWPLIVIAIGLLIIFGLGGREKKHPE